MNWSAWTKHCPTFIWIKCEFILPTTTLDFTVNGKIPNWINYGDDHFNYKYILPWDFFPFYTIVNQFFIPILCHLVIFFIQIQREESSTPPYCRPEPDQHIVDFGVFMGFVGSNMIKYCQPYLFISTKY